MHQISKVGMTKGKKEGWKEEKKKGKGGKRLCQERKTKIMPKKGERTEKDYVHIYI